MTAKAGSVTVEVDVVVRSITYKTEDNTYHHANYRKDSDAARPYVVMLDGVDICRFPTKNAAEDACANLSRVLNG